MRDFRKLTVWQKADDLAVEVYRLTGEHFPGDERFGLTSQIRRAAVSVAANIAEGSARQTLKEFRQFLYAARGSLVEVEYYLHLAHRLGYLPEDATQAAAEAQAEVARLLQGFMNSIEEQMQRGRTDN
jgi:four helix bundle protein